MGTPFIVRDDGLRSRGEPTYFGIMLQDGCHFFPEKKQLSTAFHLPQINVAYHLRGTLFYLTSDPEEP